MSKRIATNKQKDKEIDDHQSILDAYVQYFENLKPRDLVLISKYFDKDARFKDPFNDVVGHRAIRHVFDHMFSTVSNPKFKVMYAGQMNEHMAFLRWDFMFEHKGKKRVIPGCSEVTFGQNGLVVSHIDYWDPAENIYERIPFIKGIIKFLKNKLSAR